MYSRAKKLIDRIDWINASFLLSAHLAALFGAWILIHYKIFYWQTILLFFFMLVSAGLSITVGYHRLFAHKSFQGHWAVKLFLLLFGAAAFQNCARKWSSDHRRHHKYVDTGRDPYNIKEGFLFAHIGWVLLKIDDTIKYDDVPDLNNDPLVMFQEKHYVPLAIGFGFVFPTLLASLWGDPLGGFFLAGWIRLIINEHFTFSINSFSHYFGKQPYSDVDTSRDNWLFAFFSYGEGYHNYHHKFPFDYRNAVKYHQWDPSKWMIHLLSWMGLTQGLRRAPKEAILQARLKMDEKRIIHKLNRVEEKNHPVTQELVATARLKFEQAYTRCQSLKKEYAQLKEEKIKMFQSQIATLNAKLDDLKKELASARLSLKEAMKHWGNLCQRLGIVPTKATV